MTATATDLHDDVLALLQAIQHLNVFDGKVNDDGEDAPPVDPDGRVHPYAVLYVSPGRKATDRLAGTTGALAWSCQVTVAGGDPQRALWALDRVRAALTGARLAVPGTPGRLTEATDPGPIREDDQAKPSRFYVPLIFGLTAN